VKPFDNILDDGFGYYLTTHPESPERYGDRAVPVVVDSSASARLPEPLPRFTWPYPMSEPQRK